MIENDVVRARFRRAETAELNAVASGADAAPGPDSEMSNDDVMNAVIITGDNTLDRDASARGSLAGYRNVGFRNADVSADDTTHLENDDPWSIGGAGFREAPRTRGV